MRSITIHDGPEAVWLRELPYTSCMKKTVPQGSGIVIGITIGIAIGTALDNIGIGIALGIALGAAFDSANSQKK